MGGVWESVEETVAGWHSQQPNSPPVTTSKTTPTWCRITNRDKKDGRWLNLCNGMELCARVCGYNGKGGASERRETEGIKRIMTPSHNYLCLPLWPPMPITEIRHPVPVWVHTHKCVYFFSMEQNVRDAHTQAFVFTAWYQWPHTFSFPLHSPLCQRGVLPQHPRQAKLWW